MAVFLASNVDQDLRKALKSFRQQVQGLFRVCHGAEQTERGDHPVARQTDAWENNMT